MGHKNDGFTWFYPPRTIIIWKSFTTHKIVINRRFILSKKKYTFIVANGSKGKKNYEIEPHRTSSRDGVLKAVFPFLSTRAKYF